MLHDPKWDKQVEVELDAASRSLLSAAAYIEEHGWCQGVLRKDTGAVCVVGAFLDINCNYEVFSRSSAAIGVPPGVISRWNDAPSRTKNEVINSLRKAAYFGK